MTDQYQTVIVGIEDKVAFVTLNRPERHNAFDEHMIAELSDLWDDLAGRDDLVAVIVRGAGKSFCAGADLDWMKRAAGFSPAQNHADAQALSAMLYKFYSLPKLTIAYVYGAALGGGMGLACCADIVVADETASFGLSEVRLGLVPATISPYVVRAIGVRQSRRYFQTGERIDGLRAYRIGLVHDYAERPEDGEYLVQKIVREARLNGPQAMAAAKKLALDVAERPLDDALRRETAELIATIRSGDEAREGLDAFLNKRKPSWV